MEGESLCPITALRIFCIGFCCAFLQQSRCEFFWLGSPKAENTILQEQTQFHYSQCEWPVLLCRDPTYSVARAMAAPILHVKDAYSASVKGTAPDQTDTSEVHRDDDLASSDSLGSESSSGLDSPRIGQQTGKLSTADCYCICTCRS